MKNSTKAILLSIASLLLFGVALLTVVYAFSVNIMLGIIAMFLISAPGGVWKKAYNLANASDSALTKIFVRFITPALFVVATFGFVLGFGHLLGWFL